MEELAQLRTAIEEQRYSEIRKIKCHRAGDNYDFGRKRFGRGCKPRPAIGQQ